MLKLDQQQLTRLGVKLGAEISGRSARRPKTENPELPGPQWARDKWYRCYFCKAWHQGKYNLRRHQYRKHREDLARDMEVPVDEVEELYSDKIKNLDAESECEKCGSSFNQTYLKYGHAARCAGKKTTV